MCEIHIRIGKTKFFFCCSDCQTRNEDKQTQNLVSFDPANFEVSKIYQGDAQS